MVESHLRSNPFLAYAAEYSTSHLHVLDSPALSLSFLVVKLLDQQAHRDTLIWLTYYLTCFGNPHGLRGASGFHSAEYYKLRWLVTMYCTVPSTRTKSKVRSRRVWHTTC